MNKTKDRETTAFNYGLLASFLLGFIVGVSFSQALFFYIHKEKPLLSPLAKMVFVVPVEAKQKIVIKPSIKTVATKGFQYPKHASKKYYPQIISKLKELYGNDWEKAAELNARENGFNPMSINPSSGACGLTQALPCSKLTCKLGDVNCDLEWQKNYIDGRYGNASKALAFHYIKNWY